MKTCLELLSEIGELLRIKIKSCFVHATLKNRRVVIEIYDLDVNLHGIKLYLYEYDEKEIYDPEALTDKIHLMHTFK
jgi:hypothetical protein